MKKLIAAAAGTIMLSGVAFARRRRSCRRCPRKASRSPTGISRASMIRPTARSARSWTCSCPADGKVNALIIGVGGFLGMGEKDVAVPFSAVKHTTRDGKVYLTLDTTKDALKAAPGLKYDRSTTTWMPETK